MHGRFRSASDRDLWPKLSDAKLNVFAARGAYA